MFIQAARLLNNGQSSLDAVVEAIKCLEDEELTNAGYGSNLNMQGYVECDAGVMDGRDLLFGSVGALQSIKNPIVVAKLLIDRQREPTPLGLVPPSFLVAEGAKNFAVSKGCDMSQLESNRSQETYNKNKQRLDQHLKARAGKPVISDVKQKRLDTVGAVCVDDQGHVAAGVSSGGIILKSEGRVGQAAIIGAGCWAEQDIAVTTTGIGEYLMRTSLARQCALELSSTVHEDHFYDNALNKVFERDFFGSPLMKNIPRDDHLAGVLGLKYFGPDPDNTDRSVEMMWAHSTSSMCIAYMGTKSEKASAFISDMPDYASPGSLVLTQSRLFHL